MGWIAGGDAKLVAALGALGGISLGLEAIFLGLFFSGAFVFVRLCWQGVFFKTVVNGFAVAATRTVIRGKAVAPRPEFTSTLRFGPFALAGAALSLVLHGGLL
jgi:prepilin peptidase CpaA